MSHDCDCSSCQETDSRWAYTRKMKLAKEKDCPRGIHVPSLWSSNPKNGESEYRCDACHEWCDNKGNRVVFPRVPGEKDHYPCPSDCWCLGLKPSKHIMDIPTPCRLCGLTGPHFCVGKVKPFDEGDLARLAEDLKCKTHPRYQAKRKPRVACEACWRKYITLNP